jgi:uncharacterized membrane protein YdfJ with MMPL/SSD domain
MENETYNDTEAGDSEKEKLKAMVPILSNTNRNFINTTWRPMMAWVYMLVILFDFIVFPIFWSSLQVYQGTLITIAWDPITLKSGGFFHLAMGAVLGITAYGRTREKLESKDYSI